ncbi:MAG: helix-turn-helix transcriptional regulator [Minisyncoccota bacterium]
MKLISIKAVAERTGVSKRQLYTEVAEGRFPRPVQLTSRRVGWVESEIDAWIEGRIARRDAGMI